MTRFFRSAPTIPGGRGGTWLRHRQISGGGAVLVRPDRFIALRHPAGTGDPRAALAAALSQILARPVGAPVASAA